MLLTIPSARLPCSAILSRLPRSISTTSSTAARSSLPRAATAGAVVSFSSSNNSPESSAKLLTELSGFDLVGDAGSQLAECRHLLRMNEARLRRLQFLQRHLGGVTCCADLGLGALPLRDAAVDQHDPAAGYGIARTSMTAIGAAGIRYSASGCFSG